MVLWKGTTSQASAKEGLWGIPASLGVAVARLLLADKCAVEVDIVENGVAVSGNFVHDQGDGLHRRPGFNRWADLRAVGGIEADPLPAGCSQRASTATRTSCRVNHVVVGDDHKLRCFGRALAVGTHVKAQLAQGRAGCASESNTSDGRRRTRRLLQQHQSLVGRIGAGAHGPGTAVPASSGRAARPRIEAERLYL